MILLDLIGCVLKLCNKVLKFSFCPLGSNRGRKLTFSRQSCHLNFINISRRRPMLFQEMIGHVLHNKVSEFSFIWKGQMTFLFFVKVCHLNYIYIFRSSQLILQDVIGYVLQMCSKDSEFSIYPLRSYEGRKNYVFCRIRLVTCTPSKFQIVDK